MRTSCTVLLSVILLAVLAAPAGTQAQEPPSKHTSNDPFKCKACAPALQKALGFLAKKGAGGDVHRQCLMGFVYMASGRHPKELQRCINRACSGYKGGGFNGNWSIAMCAIFLSEVYKRMPSDKVRGKLVDLLKVAAENQEPSSGGWSHNLGFKYPMGEKGATVDLGILTAMMFGAMLNMKVAGIQVPDAMFKAAQENIEKNSDGMGIGYGTGNRAGDRAMSRGAWAYLGLHAAKYSACKLYKTVPRGLKSRYKNTNDGHAYPPLHYSAVALALHLLGPQEYDKFFRHWADTLIGLQKEDGSIELPHSESIKIQGDDGYVGSTAAFALVLLLQKPGAMKKGAQKNGGSNTSTAGKGIFGNRDKPKSDARPWLGLRVSNSGFGVTVKSIHENSPCRKGGVRDGDLIVAFDGRTFDDINGLKALVDKARVGRSVKMTVLRAGDKKILIVTIGEVPTRNTADTASEEGQEI